MVHMMDDFAFFADTREEAVTLRDMVLKDLEELGFYVSWKKSLLDPAQVFKFLGFVVDLRAMRKYVPGEKIEEVEQLVRQLLEEEGKDLRPTIRRLLRVVGKVVSMGQGLLPARLLTRETYRIIRPENDDYDAEVKLTKRVLEEFVELLRVLRVWNTVGVPIRRDLRMVEVRVMMDSGTNAGWCIDGQKGEVVMVPGWSRGGGTGFTPEEEKMWQVQKELLTVALMLQEEGESLRGKRVLLWTDCVAVREYIRKGMGTSDVMTDVMKVIMRLALQFGIALFAEWVKGTVMVVAGVDGMSRQHEGMLRPELFKGLDRHRLWGHRAGFKGYGLDLFASEATRQGKYRGLPFCQRGGGGASMGDARTVQLDPAVLHWVSPPLAVEVIAAVLQRLQQEGVAATVVVPDWKGQAFHTWLMRYKVGDVWQLPWCSWPATFWDVSEGKVKPHVTNRWQFVAVNVDFRGAGGSDPGLEGAVPRPVVQAQKRRPGPVRVLSLCDGLGGAAVALEMLGVEAIVASVEWCEQARKVAGKWRGVQQVVPHNLRDPGWQGAELQLRLDEMGSVDVVVCGFPCQDVSTANKNRTGLEGINTSLVSQCHQVLTACRCRWPWVRQIFECSVEETETKVMQMLNDLLGSKALTIQAKLLCAAERKRRYWVDFVVPPLQFWLPHMEDGLCVGEPYHVLPSQVLEPGRKPAPRWRKKLPTIMASGPGSWNMGEVVVDARTPKERGPLTLEEAERAMGLPAGASATDVEGQQVENKPRWKMVGNSFAVPVMTHLLVSCLRSLGIVTRNDVRQPGSPYTINYDGPRWPVELPEGVVRGWVTRDDARQEGQVWTVNQDGPRELMVDTPGGWWRRCVVKKRGRGVCMVRTDSMHRREAAEVPTARVYVCVPELVGARVTDADRRRCQLRWPEKGPRWKSALAGGRVQPGAGDTAAALVWRSAGVPRPTVLSREQGWDAKKWRGRLGELVAQDAGVVDTLTRDWVVLSKAENTWKSYKAWWGVFEEHLSAFGVQWWPQVQEPSRRAEVLRQMRVAFESSVSMMGIEYAFSTMEVYTAAVQNRFTMEQWGYAREGTMVGDIMEGIKRWRGKEGTSKKRPVEGLHVAWMLAQEQAPREWKLHGQRGWQFAVAMIILGWMTGMRRREVAWLSACDVHWSEDGCRVFINRTKNDQAGVKRDAYLEFGDRNGVCPLRFVWAYARDYGKLQRGCRCTSEAEPQLECMGCPRLFENVLNNGKVRNCQVSRGLQKARSTTVVQQVFAQVARAGLVKEEDLRLYTAKSMRVGAVSAAAAGGVREAVAASHMRMKSVGTLQSYDHVLGQEKGMVSRVMLEQVRKGTRGR
jgi:hypothetical protein